MTPRPEHPAAQVRREPEGYDEDVWFEGPNDLAFVGTCQSCGAYWDVRKQPVCPCGGYVG